MMMALICLALIASIVVWILSWQLFSLKDRMKNQTALLDTFHSLSKEALAQNNRMFLDLAKSQLDHQHEKAKGDLEKKQEAISHIIDPMKKSLEKLDQLMHSFDRERKGQHESLLAQMNKLVDAENRLRHETMTLSRALRAPTTRGKWGELQLKRVMELAGMQQHCDFYEQLHMQGEEAAIRPDVVIHLPGNRFVAIDAKVPLEFYLQALDKEESERQACMRDHARSIKQHIIHLGKKRYWQTLDNSPEFVVLFLPSETFFSAALETDPSLIEVGVDHGVILTTPTTLIALLRTVAYSWKQETLSQNAQKICDLGCELNKRLSDMAANFSKLGRSLTSSIEAFNRTVGSFESRVLVTARKFESLGTSSDQMSLDPIEMIEKMPRILASESALAPEESE